MKVVANRFKISFMVVDRLAKIQSLNESQKLAFRLLIRRLGHWVFDVHHQVQLLRKPPFISSEHLPDQPLAAIADHRAANVLGDRDAQAAVGLGIL